jgi:hypothetical protein
MSGTKTKRLAQWISRRAKEHFRQRYNRPLNKPTQREYHLIEAVAYGVARGYADYEDEIVEFIESSCNEDGSPGVDG